MLTQNKEMFDFINLSKYHESGFTGKWVKVFVLEPNKDHRKLVIRSLQQSAPDVEVLTVDGRGYGNYADMILDSGANIVTCSYTTKYMEPEDSLRLLDAGITLFCAAGNEDDHTHMQLSKDPSWISVGALVYNDKTDSIKLEDYSSKTEYLDVVDFIPYSMGGYVFLPSGTSFSAPFRAGRTACYFQYFFTKYGRYPTHDEIISEFQKNSKDLGDVGYDISYGNGVWVMPSIENKIIRLKIGDKIGYVNGIPIQLDVSPKIENSRTLVPLRFVAENMDYNVEWIEKSQEIILSK